MSLKPREQIWEDVVAGKQKLDCQVPHRHEIAGECDACTSEFVKMIQHHDDEGPWFVNEHGNPESSDFTHDVILEINGDFFDDQQRAEYAKHLVDILNSHIFRKL